MECCGGKVIISHKNKYLFVEIPFTGSTAISQELCELYEGEQILKKHSYYSDFLKNATPEERCYFVFYGIRNPLDEAVSKYYKLAPNQRGKFTDPEKLKKRNSIDQRRKTSLYKEIKKKNLDFETFFLNNYHQPYNNWSCFARGHCDYVIRFESLQEDFARVLQLLGLEPKRPLPVRNSTAERKKDFLSYYSPRLIPRAKRVFGPFMKQWGYEFPSEWGGSKITRLQQFEFEVFTLLRKVKWKHLRSIYYSILLVFYQLYQLINEVIPLPWKSLEI